MALKTTDGQIKTLVCLIAGFAYCSAHALNEASDSSKAPQKMENSISNNESSLYTRFGPSNAQIPIQFGLFGTKQGKSQFININTLIGDQFNVQRESNINGLFGLGYFVKGTETSQYDISFGINAFYLAKQSVGGTVTQESMFTNLAYSYNVTNYPIYLAAKAALKEETDKYNVTFDLGIGPNIVHTSDVHERSLDGITLPDHIFGGRTTAAFSASAGIGLRLNHVYKDIPLECGYRFFYLGSGSFKTLSSQVLNDFVPGSGYGSAVLCSLTV